MSFPCRRATQWMFAFMMFLLLALTACSTKREPYGETGAVPPQPLLPALESPLLTYANHLTANHPEESYVTLLDIGSEALLARTHLIRSAKESIEIQSIIWANDEAGRLVMYELIQAARRGVRVQVLIDHLASEPHVDIAAFLASVHPNLEIKFYNPVTGLTGRLEAAPSFLDKFFALLLKFKRFNQRMHNKTFIVDGNIGITGGRNYQNAYFDHSPGMNYKDRDILVIGPAVRAMQGSFKDYWNFKHSVSLADLEDVKKLHKKEKVKHWGTRESFRIDKIFEQINQNADSIDLVSRLFIEPLLKVKSAYFIADAPWKVERQLLIFNERSLVTQELARLASKATKSMTIQTPYLVLSSPAIALFKKLRKNYPEINIRVSTNSLAATDSWHVYALSYKQKQTYLQTLGFKIFEFKPYPEDLPFFAPKLTQAEALASIEKGEQKDYPYLCLHAKSLVIDDEVAFVGSYNLDPRSENLNTEAGLFIVDRDFAARLKDSITLDMGPHNSWVVARKKIPLGIGHMNSILVKLSNIIPLVDIWPFRYSASFELIDGQEAVSADHPDFYENYKDVGSFPTVNDNKPTKGIATRGTKAFLSFVKPLL